MRYLSPTNYGKVAMHSLFQWRYAKGDYNSSKTKRLFEADQKFGLVREYDACFTIYPHGPYRDSRRIYALQDDVLKAVVFKAGEENSVEFEPDARVEKYAPQWLSDGLVEALPVESKSWSEIANELDSASRQYPFFSIDYTSVELTGLCNLACERCYRMGSRPEEVGLPVETIKSALRTLLLLGMPMVTFSGGEASLRENDLLELIQFVKPYLEIDLQDRSDAVSVLSNGVYSNPERFLGALRDIGGVVLRITLPSFNEKVNDRESGRPGAFAAVKNTVLAAKRVGYSVSIMAHDIGGHADEEAERNRMFFEAHATRIYSGPADTFERIGSAAFYAGIPETDSNSINAFGRLKETDQAHQPGWCKCLAHPHNIFIRPTGNVGPCLYTSHLDEEFGSLRNNSLAEIINAIHDSAIYRLFRDGNIERSQHLVDTRIFPGTFRSACTPMVVTLTFAACYEKYLSHGYSPEIAQLMANEETARLTGYKRN